IRFGTMEGRRAEPCVAQRADRTPGKDWLPKIAAVHSITSYPVGSMSEPIFRMHAARKPMRMRPIYETALVGPWVARSSSILYGARRQPWRAFACPVLCLHGCSGGAQPGGEIAPQRHDQFARQRDDGD